jgi:hypothetical protein
MWHFKITAGALAATVVAKPALAEVSDKMPSPAGAWAVSTVIASLAFCVCYSFPRAVWVALPIALLAAWYVGGGEPDILASYKLEADSVTYDAYRANWILSSALMPVGAIAGAVLGVRRRRASPPNTSVEQPREG